MKVYIVRPDTPYDGEWVACATTKFSVAEAAHEANRYIYTVKDLWDTKTQKHTRNILQPYEMEHEEVPLYVVVVDRHFDDAYTIGVYTDKESAIKRVKEEDEQYIRVETWMDGKRLETECFDKE